MAAANALEAFYTALRAQTSVTSLLAHGADSILMVGQARPTTDMPYITLTHGGDQHGDGSSLNYFSSTIRVRVYYNQDTSSFFEIEAIMKALRPAMNNADLGTISGIGFLCCYFSGYSSGALFDFNLRQWMREMRFDVHQSQQIIS